MPCGNCDPEDEEGDESCGGETDFGGEADEEGVGVFDFFGGTSTFVGGLVVTEVVEADAEGGVLFDHRQGGGPVVPAEQEGLGGEAVVRDAVGDDGNGRESECDGGEGEDFATVVQRRPARSNAAMMIAAMQRTPAAEPPRLSVRKRRRVPRKMSNAAM